jgi:hypothetical protein
MMHYAAMYLKHTIRHIRKHIESNGGLNSSDLFVDM